jgi:hypothetical protein
MQDDNKIVDAATVDYLNHYAFETGVFSEKDYLTPEQLENVRKMEDNTTRDMVRHILLNEC